ncbi:MAG TPA: VOC family protein [Bradyrhizobium sp.]|jgi:PhnB protein|nr:VOC family protein [Bradyrhizobium sp.]
MLNPYLFYNGNCEAAFKYYEKVLGGKIEFLMRADEGPADMKPSPGNEKKIMHARMSIGAQLLMASDAPPDHFHKPQGFAVSLTVTDLAEAEKKFKALAEGGAENMPFEKTFFSKGFGMCVDQFGQPWMVNCPLEGMG